jgi:hypothetical protein
MFYQLSQLKDFHYKLLFGLFAVVLKESTNQQNKVESRRRFSNLLRYIIYFMACLPRVSLTELWTGLYPWPLIIIYVTTNPSYTCDIRKVAQFLFLFYRKTVLNLPKMSEVVHKKEFIIPLTINEVLYFH